MATFPDDPEEWQRLDWQLLRNSPIAPYHSPSILEQDIAWLRSHAYRIDDTALGAAMTEAAFHTLIACELDFPEYYGRDLDALNDCLSDLDISMDGGRALVLRSFDAFSRQHAALAHGLLDILATNARRFLLTGRRLLVLAQSADPEITFDAVGATPVVWNPREWLDTSRSSRAAS